MYGYIVTTIFVLGVGLYLAGCRPGTTWDTYEDAIDSGRREIAVVQEIEQLFPDQAQHFITHYGFHSGPNTWHTEVLLHERYVLKLNVKVQLNHTFTEVVGTVSEPQFFLHEVRSVDMSKRRLSPGDQWQFGRDDWRKVVNSDGDFGVIGIQLTKDRPVAEFTKIQQQIRAQRER